MFVVKGFKRKQNCVTGCGLSLSKKKKKSQITSNIKSGRYKKFDFETDYGEIRTAQDNEYDIIIHLFIVNLQDVLFSV